MREIIRFFSAFRLKVPRMGFEPIVSRHLKASGLPVAYPDRKASLQGFEPQSPESDSGILPLDEREMVRSLGFEPRASLVLSQRGRPLPSRAQYLAWDSNPDFAD